MFTEPIDAELFAEQVDELFDIISNKIDYLEHRDEHDQLTFLGGQNINIGLFIEVLTYVFGALFTVYQAVLENREEV